MSRKGYCVISHVGASQNYCVSHLSSRRSDGGLTMQVSCLKDKPNMRAGAKGDTPEVVGRYRSSIRDNFILFWFGITVLGKAQILRALLY